MTKTCLNISIRLIHAPALAPPPAFRERRHRILARRLIAVRRGAVLVIAERERPLPRRADRRGGCFHDAAHDSAIGEHVENRRSDHWPDGREAEACLRIKDAPMIIPLALWYMAKLAAKPRRVVATLSRCGSQAL